MATMIPDCLNTSMLINNASGGLQPGDEDEMDEYNKHLAKLVKHYVMKRGMPLVSALGLLGNFLALLVLTKEKLHKSLTKMEISAHIGLIGLAVSDLLFCLFVLLVTTLPFQKTYQAGDVLIYFQLVADGLITVFIITSTWLIVVMAAERYVAVCHPLRARNLISLCRTRAYVTVLFLLCPFCTIPVFLESFIQTITCADGRLLYQVRKVSRESVVVRRFVWAMCFDFLPCAALIYFNTCLIWKIHKAKQLREKMAPHHASSFCMHSNSGNVRKFRWDGHNTKRGVSSFGDNADSPSTRKSLITSLPNARGKHLQDIHIHDQLESSDSNDMSHCNANFNGSGVEVRREVQLLCKPGSNGVVKTSAHLSPASPPCHNLQCRQNRLLSSRRRFSDNALNSVTATLVAVVLTFLILVSPWELLKFGLLYSSSAMDSYKIDTAMYITNFMQVLNFSFNFVLYCLVNKSFRNTLKKLICLQPISSGLKWRPADAGH